MLEIISIMLVIDGGKEDKCVEQLKPNILIRDDCKSIGGLKAYCLTDVKGEIKKYIQSIW